MDALTAEAGTAAMAGGGAEVDIGIEGMTCASCVGRVERVLKQVPGVSGVSVNLATERARVAFAGPPDTAAVARAVEEAGYDVPVSEFDLNVQGMTCASCVGRVER
ncbi:copper ion binding protein, partial [Roseomonas rosea]